MRYPFHRTSAKRGVAALFLPILIFSSVSLFSQNRDFNTERLILDDNAGDGTRNTLTLQTPVAGLSADRTLIFPDADGAILSSVSPLVADGILFGTSGGQVGQNSEFIWDDAGSIFDIGDGAFSVDGTNGNTTVGGDLFLLGSMSDPLSDLSIEDSLVPTVDNSFSLGTDDNRFSELYVNGSSVHIGESGGEVSGFEMAIGFFGIVGEINILGGDPELAFNADALEIQMDAEGDGTVDAAVTGGGIRVNSDVGTNAVYSESGISRNGGATETFAFSNLGGDLDVTVNGDLDVTGTLTAGTIDLGLTQGSVTFADGVGSIAEDNANFFWDDVNNRLGIGNNAPAVALDVNGGVNVSGVTTLGNGTAVANSRLVIDDGHLTTQQTTAPVAAAAGANVTSAVLTNSTDVAGFIDVTTSGTPLAGAQATVTFDAAYNTAPVVVLTPANGSAVGVGAYVTRTTAGFTINFIGVPAASTSHQYFYQVIEAQ